MKLLVVESPAKARKIKSFLGSEYCVEASIGHVREIPPKGINIDIENGFVPIYQVSKSKVEVVKKIKSAAAKAEIVYLATDPDREGEAIAWHLYDLLPSASQRKCKRVSYDQVTKKAVTDAIANARDIDMHLVDAQKARQILDRLIGYRVSPILWYSVAKGTSAGRVQSIALSLICERQKEIDAFKPEDYWHVDAKLACKNGEFWARVVVPQTKDNRFTKEAEADKAVKDLNESEFSVSEIDRSQKKVSPSPPFDTSSLQSACSSMMRWSATKTMQVAQGLYEAGHIVYHRTDSYHVAPEALEAARNMISGFGPKYLPDQPNVYHKKSGAAAQEAHECIRPTHLDEDGGMLDGDDKRMYVLIRDRFIASQMTPMILNAATYLVKASKGRDLTASGQSIEFDGFAKIWQHSKPDDTSLPAAEKGEKLDRKEVKLSKHTTKPPDRYNDGSIIKKMESEGVGRPSTRASILKALQEKGYVRKDGTAFVALPIGFKICDFLIPAFKQHFMDIKFTAGVEDDLDEIASGRKAMLDVMTAFYDKLKGEVRKAKEIKREIKTFGECPACKKGLITERIGIGQSFYSCSAYPKCKAKFKMQEDGTFVMEEPPKKTGKKCPRCEKGDLLVRKSRFGEFIGCSGYPKCRYKANLGA